MFYEDFSHCCWLQVCKNESDVPFDEVQKFFKAGVLFKIVLKAFPNHGIFAHEHFCATSQSSANILDLLRGHVVGLDKKDFAVSLM